MGSLRYGESTYESFVHDYRGRVGLLSRSRAARPICRQLNRVMDLETESRSPLMLVLRAGSSRRWSGSSMYMAFLSQAPRSFYLSSRIPFSSSSTATASQGAV